MGGRTRKLRNQARRKGLTQTERWDDGTTTPTSSPAAAKPEAKEKKNIKKAFGFDRKGL